MRSEKSAPLYLWAVDPAAAEKKLQLRTLHALAKLAKANGAMIEPVAVLSPERLKVPALVFFAEEKKYEIAAETLLKSWVAELKMPNLLAPRLLARGINRDNNAINTFMRYAHSSQASLIAIGTHNRKGLDKFLLGSFAESLILRSDIPLFVVHPKDSAAKKVTKIFFPTDFSDASHLAFKRLLPVAKALKAKVVLYFKFEYLVPATVEVFAVVPSYKPFLKKDRQEKDEQAQTWVKAAKEAGVKVEVVLDQSESYVAEGIIKAQKRSKADVIAMASSSGPIASALVGSVTRTILRMSQVPVWILHPNAEAIKAESALAKPTATHAHT